MIKSKETKSERITIRCTLSELKMVKGRAKFFKVPVSRYIIGLVSADNFRYDKKYVKGFVK